MIAERELPFLPLTLNEILKAAKESRYEYADLKRQFTRDCAIALLTFPPFPGKVWVSFTWYVRTLRRDPADNTPAAAKFILDGLVDAGVLKDDSGFVIQPPVIHWWEKRYQEGCKLMISDRPIYSINRVA